MNTLFMLSGQVLPCLIGGKREHRRNQSQESVKDGIHDRLCAFTLERVCPAGIDAVFEDIEVEGTHLYSAEAVDRVIQHMKLVLCITGEHFLFQQFKLVKRPAVNLRHLCRGDGVLCRIEIVEVTENIFAGIPDAAVRLGKAGENLLGDADIVTVVLGSHPEAEYFGAVLLDNLFRSNHVADRFAHFAAGTVNDEAVGKDILIGRDTTGADTFQQ